MKKMLFIHIGLNKTGSSSLQKFLYDNHQLLFAQEILYPRKNTYTKQHKMLALCLDYPDAVPDCEHLKLTPEQNYSTCWPEFIEEAMQSSAHKIVISSEFFMLTKNIAKVARYCQEFDTKIIIYLRRQDQYLQSCYNQAIKGSRRQLTLTADKFLEEKIHRADFAGLLERWATHFGQKNIIVRIYERNQLPNGIENDFADIIGFDYKAMSASENANPSLQPQHVAVLKVINEIGLHHEQHEHFTGVMKKAASKSSFGCITQHDLFSPQQCHDILSRFEEDNKKIARCYLGRKDGVLFTDPLPDLTMSWKENKLLTPIELVQEVLIPYMTLNGERPLTIERVIKELLIPYIKKMPIGIDASEQLAKVNEKQQQVKNNRIKKIVARTYQRIKQVMNF